MNSTLEKPNRTTFKWHLTFLSLLLIGWCTLHSESIRVKVVLPEGISHDEVLVKLYSGLPSDELLYFRRSTPLGEDNSVLFDQQKPNNYVIFCLSANHLSAETPITVPKGKDQQIEIPMEKGGTIQGVIKCGLNPVENVRISFTPSGRRGIDYSNVYSAKDGSFCSTALPTNVDIDVTPYAIMGYAPPEKISMVATHEKLVFNMTKIPVIKVKFFDELEQAVQDFKFTCYDLKGKSRKIVFQGKATKEMDFGEISLKDFGDYIVSAQSNTISATSKPIRIDIDSDDYDLELRASPLAPEIGFVTDDLGNPLKDVCFYLQSFKNFNTKTSESNPPLTFSDEKGQFSIKGLEKGEKVFVFHHETSGTQFETGTEKNHRLTLNRIGQLSGNVLDENGKGISRVFIRATSKKGGQIRDAFTDQDGHYEINTLWPGNWDLMVDIVTADQRKTVHENITIAPGQILKESFALNQRDILLKGHISYFGYPVDGASLCVALAKNEKGKKNLEYSGKVVNGAFEVKLPKAGVYVTHFHLNKENLFYAWPKLLNVTEYGLTDLFVEVQNTVVKGVVTDANGKALKNARVEVKAINKESRGSINQYNSTRTNLDGSYYIPGLTPGEHSLKISLKNKKVFKTKIDLNEGQLLIQDSVSLEDE